MISKNKTEEAAELYTGISLKLLVPEAEITNTVGDLYNYSMLDFKSGVEFAEKELESLAIEFVEWCILNEYERTARRDLFIWRSEITPMNYTTQELFGIFKKEKYDTNK